MHDEQKRKRSSPSVVTRTGERHQSALDLAALQAPLQTASRTLRILHSLLGSSTADVQPAVQAFALSVVAPELLFRAVAHA